ncbi:MAG: hypothetical protein ACLQQ4_18695 [Bacteroidia bacterium]
MKQYQQNYATRVKPYILCGICLLTFFCFRNTLHNQFTYWDDDVYVTNNPYIRSLSWENIKFFFTKIITGRNYHPLTVLSLALNYSVAQLSPLTYYLTNIILHIINVIFVFLLIKRLCNFMSTGSNNGLLMAYLCALWFGIHPMHVESVAWLSERKDVLYAFFYLSGCLAYLNYKSNFKWGWYALTFLLFVASCLSKAMAVVLPLSLILMDMIIEKKWSYWLFLEKIPFFIAALALGVLAFQKQKETGSIAPLSVFPFHERILYACYGFTMYIVKLFLPIKLSMFYPYPLHNVDGMLPFIYYIAPLFALLIPAIPLFITYKKNKTYFKILLFGLGFYFINLIFVLQLISFGSSVMADRYCYISYIGLFFITAYFIQEVLNQYPQYKIVVWVLVAATTCELSYLCYERTKVWHDTETLFKSAIDEYPDNALLPLKFLGNYYMDIGEYDKALNCYNKILEFKKSDPDLYIREGHIYRLNRNFEQAINLYSVSLQLDSMQVLPYLYRSATYALEGNYSNAAKDYLTACKMNPASENVFGDMLNQYLQSKQYGDAICQYNMLISINPKNPVYYFFRGVAQFGRDSIKKSIEDFLVAYNMKPNEAAPSAAYNLSVAYDKAGNDSAAFRYVNIAKSLGFKVADDYYNTLRSKSSDKSK